MTNPYAQFQWGDLWFFLALILALILSATLVGVSGSNIPAEFFVYPAVAIELAYIFLVIKKRKVKK